ncbi:hypothetical protein [Saccharothrix stipae]
MRALPLLAYTLAEMFVDAQPGVGLSARRYAELGYWASCGAEEG